MLQQQKAIEGLRKLKGSVMGRRPTREERAKTVEEGFTSKRNILKEYGLE